MPIFTAVSPNGCELTVEYVLENGAVHSERYVYPSSRVAQRHMPAVLAEANLRAAMFEHTGGPTTVTAPRVKRLPLLRGLAFEQVVLTYADASEYRRLPRPVFSWQARGFYLGYRWRAQEAALGLVQRG